MESEQWTCEGAGTITQAYVYGGTAAISDTVLDVIAERANGDGCG